MKILTTPNFYNQRKSAFLNAAQDQVQPAGEPEETTTPPALDEPADPEQDEKQPAKIN